ncbi:Clan SB, family S8, subtilisin-like serine peptidase [Trichomonas vaginalis G3]|uniref:Clan SB, family S8, subtilisin-like serine peptidase n=1 Tax=Trichomonas vaginalis (strain ATCC PRA-98 / G3) TaxID=412133 RepID=A2EUN3_TRIV3|nr:serine-type endopeptidase protein [Trichomonas vaginalis G3]EAY03621.1 Clan SB, family S8, subtilisin-like serine peptidase [Trichomonas vaginalis G3]KAI5524716.1 serine-type endopeptidase protein [Trichomonas vaginalis G3]|eukprot:XP_001315844.1 Clan SB, family S8, subtilisin-like serine peptidase [Trichomonas vaginalis G3]
MVFPFLLPAEPVPLVFKTKKEAHAEQRTNFRLVHFDLPKDPLFNEQFNLHNTGQKMGIPGEDLGLGNVFKNRQYTGKGVVTIVNDDGVNYEHPDLKDAIDSRYLINLGDNTTHVLPDKGYHGSGCAGVIASKWDNGVCGAGIAPGVTLGAAKFPNSIFSTEYIVKCFGFKDSEVKIHSNSWEIDECSKEGCPGGEQMHGFHDVISKASKSGVNIVFAAGNNAELLGDTNFRTISNWRENIVVAASTFRGQHAFYSEVSSTITVNAPSSYGSNAIGLGEKYTPSVQTISPKGKECNPSFGGTSASSPMVAGVLALILEANPKLKPRDLSYIISITATINDPKHGSWTKNAAGLYYSPYFGFGRIHADRAIETAKTWQNLAEEETFTAKASNRFEMTRNTTVKIQMKDNLFIETVELVFNIADEDYGDIRIEVISPSKTHAIVKQLSIMRNVPKNMIKRTITIRNFLGEWSRGTWTVGFFNRGVKDIGGYVENISINVYGTSTLPETGHKFNQVNGTSPYDYNYPDQGVKLVVPKEIEIYKVEPLQIKNANRSCSIDIFFEDPEISARSFYRSSTNISEGWNVRYDTPNLPDGLKANLVVESMECGWSVRSPVKIYNPIVKPTLAIAGFKEKNSQEVRLEWGRPSNHLNQEVPGDLIIITAINESGSQFRYLVRDAGFFIVRENMSSNSTFYISSAFCNRLEECYFHKIVGVGPVINHEVSPRYQWVIVISCIIFVLGIICIVIFAYFFLKKGKKKEYKSFDMDSRALKSMGSFF